MEATRYELPEGGISLLGYVVRRLHKTVWLAKIPRLVRGGDFPLALAHMGVYALVGATSHGRAYYQPWFDREGDCVAEADPATGAEVRARVLATRPRLALRADVSMPDGATMTTSEEILGTTVGLRGLGMPAPSIFSYVGTGWSASADGTITSELCLSLHGGMRIRGYGSLVLADSAGNRGSASIDRARRIIVDIDNVRFGANLATTTVARPAAAL
jgi:hypothetical protein